MRMKRIDVVKGGAGWVARSGRQVVLTATTKDQVVRQMAESAKAGGEPVSVRIHKADGTIQQERTYPRAADPRRSRG